MGKFRVIRGGTAGDGHEAPRTKEPRDYWGELSEEQQDGWAETFHDIIGLRHEYLGTLLNMSYGTSLKAASLEPDHDAEAMLVGLQFMAIQMLVQQAITTVPQDVAERLLGSAFWWLEHFPDEDYDDDLNNEEAEIFWEGAMQYLYEAGGIQLGRLFREATQAISVALHLEDPVLRRQVRAGLLHLLRDTAAMFLLGFGMSLVPLEAVATGKLTAEHLVTAVPDLISSKHKAPQPLKELMPLVI